MDIMNKWTLSVCAGVLATFAATAQAEKFNIVSEGDWGYSHSTYNASKVSDGNTSFSSRWAANNGSGNVNVWVDLGAVKSITDVGVVWGRGHQRTYQHDIRARASRSDKWVKIKSKGWSDQVGSHGDEEVYDVTDIQARFVRLKIYNNSSTSNWHDVIEMKVYGDSDNGSLDSSQPPSENFDLSEWKITLPESQKGYFGTGSSSAAEILPGNGCTGNNYSGRALDNGFTDDDYFYTANDGAMVFKTPLNGSSTPNSNYIRSELRELFDWNPCDSSGAANWSPRGSHILSATLKVDDYYDNDPQTVVGQIHAKDSSKALVKLQWDGPNKDIRAIINNDPDSGNPFNLDFGLVPGTDEWSYVIKLVDDLITISVTYDGKTVTRTAEFGKNGMSSKWDDHVYYFKAGNYAQAPAGTNGQFVVKFYDLRLSHN
jgi:hypothetical protein